MEAQEQGAVQLKLHSGLSARESQGPQDPEEATALNIRCWASLPPFLALIFH